MAALVPSVVGAQAGLVVRGHLSPGPEAASLTPCGTDLEYRLLLPEDLRATLVGAFGEPGTGPDERVYAELAGWPGTGPADEPAEDQDGPWRVTRLDTIRAAVPSDCEGVEAPVWTDPARIRCDGLTRPDLTGCMTYRLVEADRRLHRYTTAALGHAADPDGLRRAQRAWEEYRDVHCTAAASQWEGGSLKTLRFLGCRRSLSEGRLLTVWSEYLENASTELPDPGTGSGPP